MAAAGERGVPGMGRDERKFEMLMGKRTTKSMYPRSRRTMQATPMRKILYEIMRKQNIQGTEEENVGMSREVMGWQPTRMRTRSTWYGAGRAL